MHIDSLPLPVITGARHRNPIYDVLATELRRKPEHWYRHLLKFIPGKLRQAKITSVLNDLFSRRLKVTTRSDEEFSYVRITEDFGTGAQG